MDPEMIEKMIAGGRDSYEARLAAGQARLKRGEFQSAIEHLEKATEHKPDQTMAWQELGTAYQRSGDDDKAGKVWKKGFIKAQINGDKQAEKVIAVFLKRLQKNR
jgi:Tfp pilus assembly protein PilF